MSANAVLNVEMKRSMIMKKQIIAAAALCAAICLPDAAQISILQQLRQPPS